MSLYRFQVWLPANHTPLALFVPEIGNSLQVFADGQLIGQFGGLPPHEEVYLQHAGASTGYTAALGQVMPLPRNTANGKVSLVTAIRVWDSPDFAFFCVSSSSTNEPIRIGDANLMRNLRQQRWNYEFWSLSAQNVLVLGYLLATLAGLGLFFLRRG